MDKKSLMLHYLEGSFETYLELGFEENKAFEFAVLQTIKTYKSHPLFRTIALELETSYNEHGIEKIQF